MRWQSGDCYADNCNNGAYFIRLPCGMIARAEWLVLMVRYRNRMVAYYRIRFEREAYRHQAESDYLARRRHYRYLS